MNADNSVAPGRLDLDQRAEPIGFQMPPSLAARYELRVIDGADGGQRVGLFRPIDRDDPSIEIANDRIVARGEDRETIDALVEIARHNGWERIAVDGSPEFRRAVWEAATRDGLAVSGYEPSFAEQARADETRRASAEQRERAADREDGASAKQGVSDRDGPVSRAPAADEQEGRLAAERRDSEQLAELFLGGSAERVAAEPRLGRAIQAQAAMEQHIGEVFNGDATGHASAALQSRQMISDALRRGLDVAVREPAPVRQIEPAHARPDLER